MMEKNDRIVATCVALAVLLVSAWLPDSFVFRTLAIAFVLLFHAHALAPELFPSLRRLPGSVMTLVVLCAAQSVFQTALFYLDQRLGKTTDAVSLSATVVLFQGIFLLTRKPASAAAVEREIHAPPSRIWTAAFAVPVVVSTAFILRHAALSATTNAIRTPWPLLPSGTLAAIAIGALAVWLYAADVRASSVLGWFAGLGMLAVTLIAPILYKLGFGFDGFLHRASEQLLLTTGALSPKPPYYIGQYVFVTWLSRIFSVPFRPIDVFLVPVAILLLPLSLRTLRVHTFAFPAMLALVPLAPFVATTPQSFAYILGVSAVILACAARETRVHPSAPLAIAAWSLATHPLAGLPFFGGAVALLLPPRSALRWLSGFLAVTSVPLAFFLRRNANAAIEWNFSRIADADAYLAAFRSFLLPPRTHVALWADWSAFVAFAFPLAILASAVFAVLRERERRSAWLPLLLLGLGAVGAGFFLRIAGDFAFLIDYERGNYADRLFLVGQLFWLLPASSGLARLASRVRKTTVTGMAAFLLFAAAWQAASAYLALPRHDAVVAGHGWSVGAADFEAVRHIDQDAAGKPYTVLANQSVSAAAVETFGFKRYVGDVFYYPIPTGGPLYDLYLRATGKTPDRETVREAAKLGKSDLVYVALNDYWWDAERVGAELASSTDRIREFPAKNGSVSGGVKVYKYDFSKEKN